MAAARSVTPGGALLRTSRMFAIPNPIPQPPEINVGNRGSLTRTPVFPTHQVITTTNGARKRGDWGLKRPLPTRVTDKSTFALLRINEIDSIEGITDYSSSSDLAITLRKFQQLNLPVTISEEKSALTKVQKSVFEEDKDFTAISPEERNALVDKRWKFGGPWLAGMGQGEFKNWIERKVRPRRAEFRQFLKQKLAKERLESDREKAIDAGTELPDATAAADGSAISDDELLQYLRVLRNDRARLFDMVGQFLDLAPLKPPSNDSLGLYGDRHMAAGSESPYSARGPPVTHPSAGISYLRTSSFLENHPFYGPQKHHAPVEARVVKPRRSPSDVKLGVAGFITDRPLDSRSNEKVRQSKGNVFEQIDLNMKGGAKVFVQVQEATVNSRGRVEIAVSDVEAEAYLVAQELLGADEKTTFRKPAAEHRDIPKSALEVRRRHGYTRKPVMSSSGNYGIKFSSPSYKTFSPQNKAQ